jgi:glycosyltransferase involved in cell wall biosynthesis
MSYILKKANNYIHACINGKLKNGIKKSSKNPRITTLTAFYNREKTIKAAIRSIQNQNMPDIEILLINDASTDNSLNISKILQKQDPRIKIINNKENMGPLYSKSIGVLNANGKYIIYLDSDDLFINENLFNICYEEAEKNNIDILEFSGFQSKFKYLNVSKKQIIPLYLRYKENNLIITQPQLSTFIYKKKKNKIIKLIDGYLWGKCIRSEILRKALYTIGKNIYQQKMFYGDDRLINFILFRVAYSFKFIQEYGIIYYYTKNSIVHSNKAIKKIRNCNDELTNIMNIFKFTKNSKDSEFAAFEVKIRWNKYILPGLNRENKKYAIKFLEQILNCKFINKENKEIIYHLWKKTISKN